MASITNMAVRIQQRNELAIFQVTFYTDASHTTPLLPVDSTLYPSYTIYDLNNVAVQSGVGQAVATPGMYKAEFLVPINAPLSNDEKRWRIEWILVSTDNRQVTFVEEF